MFQGVWQRLRMWGWGGGVPKDLDALVRQEFGLRIRNRDYYDEALRHSSMLDGDTSGRMSNERLEFLGDTVQVFDFWNGVRLGCISVESVVFEVVKSPRFGFHGHEVYPLVFKPLIYFG